MIPKTILWLGLALLTVLPARALELHKIDASHSVITFEVRHLISKVRGNFSDFEGTIYLDAEDPARSRVEFFIVAKSISTNLEKRDKHLRSEEFFWVEKYPQISFRSSAIEAVSEELYNVTGTLTLRGVEKEIVLPVSYFGQVDDPWGNRKAGFATTITLNRKDFNMVWNAALDKGGVVLGDEVKLSIDLETFRLETDDEEDDDNS